jgi:hypothetical protein
MRTSPSCFLLLRFDTFHLLDISLQKYIICPLQSHVRKIQSTIKGWDVFFGCLTLPFRGDQEKEWTTEESRFSFRQGQRFLSSKQYAEISMA